MEISPEQLEQITEMAASLMQPDEIAILIDLDPEDLKHQVNHNPSGNISKAFLKGRLQTKLDLRKKIIQLAKAGSPQAEVLADKYMKSK